MIQRGCSRTIAKLGRPAVAGLLLLFGVLCIQAQIRPQPTKAANDEVRSSQAYAEVLLRRTEIQAELESLLAEYTEDFPKVTEKRYSLEAVEKERARILAVKPTEAARLTAALGKLMLGKIDAEVELWTLRRSMQDTHPEVKRAKRKVEIFEAAIKEILGA